MIELTSIDGKVAVNPAHVMMVEDLAEGCRLYLAATVLAADGSTTAALVTVRESYQRVCDLMSGDPRRISGVGYP